VDPSTGRKVVQKKAPVVKSRIDPKTGKKVDVVTKTVLEEIIDEDGNIKIVKVEYEEVTDELGNVTKIKKSQDGKNVQKRSKKQDDDEILDNED